MEDISYWMDKLNIDYSNVKGYSVIENLYDKITTCLIDNITSLIKSRCGTCKVDDFDVCLNCPLRNIDLEKLQLKYNEENIYFGLMKKVKDYCSDICIEDCSKCNLRAIKEDKSLK